MRRCEALSYCEDVEKQHSPPDNGDGRHDAVKLCVREEYPFVVDNYLLLAPRLLVARSTRSSAEVYIVSFFRPLGREGIELRSR